MTDTGHAAIPSTDGIDHSALAAVALGFGATGSLSAFTGLTIIEAALFSGMLATLVPLVADRHRHRSAAGDDLTDIEMPDDAADTPIDTAASHVFADGATTIELQSPATLPTDMLESELATVINELPTGSDEGIEDGDTILHTEEFDAPLDGDIRLTIRAPEGVADRIVDEAVRSVTGHVKGEQRTSEIATR